MGGPTDTVRLGRVRGVTVGAHWSLFAVVALVAGGLALRRLPADIPGHGPLVYWAVGLATGCSVVVAVLAHEAGHAALARPAGLEVEGITLSWLGGVTRMRGDVAGPWWEAGVAAAGPAVSAAIGAASLVAARLADGSTLLAAGLRWLALVNLSLAAFNLLPAAPLDGGRVVHGLAWRACGDRWRAAAVAGRLGAATGLAVGALGGWLVVARADALDGFALAGAGWWLASSARAEGRTAVVGRCLEGATVADIMRPVGAAPGWVTLRAFVDGFDQPHPGCVWLLEAWGGGYDGVLSGDAVHDLPGPSYEQLRPIDVAVPIADTAAASPGDHALSVLARVDGRAVVLVVEGGATVGAVLAADVARLIASGRRAVPGLGEVAASVARP